MNTQPQTNNIPLLGSYQAEDCQFLLQSIEIPMVSIEEKEILLQRLGVHYSELITQESPPDEQYLALFYKLVEKYKDRLASEITHLAQQIYQRKGSHITLVSLARAGTPVGVLLTRALKHYYPTDVSHYSISIVRDKGIDTAALEYIKQSGRAAESILFVDGWTAKGVITQELKASVANWNAHSNYQIPSDLCVISDIGGTADIVATTEDYTIPSGILNSTVSGLISRTILRPEYTGFHQCVIYAELAKHDLSCWFVDQISDLFSPSRLIENKPNSRATTNSAERNQSMRAYINHLMVHYNIDDINRVKPGIAEATRVMLRRIPKLLIVKNRASEDISHLLVLAQNKGVTIIEDNNMPFNAAAIVANVKA